ncbi:hypothetical protein ACFSKU_08170 [Pontibacter silvestris]|uniref:Uncharacterized protein n=1 Tax=Pontibacter silvestris TaxID=2305183 RepID=A0ABW4WVU0_9BACT|nr:hypothetical protein [Pontibacter silvestris]MCC9137353.1 hypothetical protein [Pontibacter silvestris]
MAQASIELVQALKETALRLAAGQSYQWGHMGSCNCGHLAQTVTQYSKGKIHGAAMWRYGDWREQLRDYCPHSGLPLDQIIDQMLDFGFTTNELTHLERLSHPRIVAKLPADKKHLVYNNRDDVVLYLNTWAALLEDEIVANISVKAEKETTGALATVS